MEPNEIYLNNLGRLWGVVHTVDESDDLCLVFTPLSIATSGNVVRLRLSEVTQWIQDGTIHKAEAPFEKNKILTIRKHGHFDLNIQYKDARYQIRQVWPNGDTGAWFPVENVPEALILAQAVYYGIPEGYIPPHTIYQAGRFKAYGKDETLPLAMVKAKSPEDAKQKIRATLSKKHLAGYLREWEKHGEKTIEG